ncbi:MAG: amino acid transporter [Methylobacterium sp.]|nr:amino acid transporter [Methylobacterium sp.]
MLLPFVTGFAIGGSLIVAIGAQNAFVLRQGIKREHVFAVSLFCALSDATLIALGVAGLGFLSEKVPGLITAVTIFGIVFLLAYGVMAARRAMTPGAMAVGQGAPLTLKAALSACAAFTFLNPHVYLDTVILVGSLAAGYAGQERWAYGMGAASASFVWFFGLGYGARVLTPLFAKPMAWRILDAIIACIMGMIALKLGLWMIRG